MKIGKRGLDHIKGYETLKLDAYKALPTEEHWTIGYGHYGPDVHEGMVITEARADELFQEDLAWVEAAVDECGPMEQNQYDGVAGLVFNIGATEFRTSTIRQLLIDRNYEDCDLEFPKWRRSSGEIVLGLRRRRAMELVLFTGA